MSPWLGDFHFLRPAWLALIPVCLALVWVLRRPRGNLSQWRRWCDPPLLAYLTFGAGGRHRRWPLVLLSLCWLLAILSLAGPVWEQRPQPLYRSEAARVIVFDLSRSMLATDLKPNRLTQARFKLADLLDASDEGQVALVAYAGEAFVVSPLTQDARTIKAMLGALEPGIMPVQGSELGEALELALTLLQRVAAVAGDVVLFTDSPGAGAAPAVEKLRAAGHRLSVIGVGTPDGAPIPDTRGGFVKATDGSIAVPRLDEPALAALAAQGGGAYFRMRADPRDVRALTEARAADRSTGEALSQESLQWYERGPWLVVLLLPLAAIAFRRGWLGSIALLALMPLETQALPSWNDLWRTPDQQAAAALEAGDPATAANRARDPMLRGEALYRQGDYAAAQRAFARPQTADAHYNRGNALARQQRYREAIEAYDRALSLEPEMEDAAYNKKLIEDLLKQQQQQQEQEQLPQDGDGAEQQQSESQESEPSETESEQQQAEQDSAAEEEQQQEQQQARRKPEPAEAEELDAEQRQALEQWLRRIPDDPGGLLRRKFLLEYQRRGSPPPATEEEW